MSRFLAYVSPAVGHTLPLVPGLLELQRRGHAVHVRTLPSLVPVLQEAGLDASPVAPEVIAVPITDYRATSDADRLHAGQVDLIGRGRHDGPDLLSAVESFRPDVVLVDVNAYGAQLQAERLDLPRAVLMPTVVPIPGKGVPAYGLGMKPAHGPLGAVRDRVLWKVVERMFGKAMLPGLNELRRELGLRELTTPLDNWRPPNTILALTSEPLEYARPDLPDNVHLVGSQPWEPPAERPAYLDEPGDPWVLVTCSTDYQGDEQLARVAAEALAGEPYRVLLTLADAHDGAGLETHGNVRVERFVPHGQVLPACAAVVSHGGMGIVGKAFTTGVPNVVVPFGRDQLEIARRVTEAGLGVSVKPTELTPQRLRAAVQQAIGLTTATRAAARESAGSDPAGRFADAAETLVPARQPAG